MQIRRIDHVGIIVRDLAAAKAFFIDLGLAALIIELAEQIN
jgi:catechol 2,3-dioxygenase-like lactoylglutathione lyase family enzyme